MTGSNVWIGPDVELEAPIEFTAPADSVIIVSLVCLLWFDPFRLNQYQ